MKRGLGRIAGELHQDVGQRQRGNIARGRHPEQTNDVDQRTQQNIGTPTPQPGKPATCLIAEHTKKWISKKRDEGAWNEHKGQRRTLIGITHELENLAWKNDNTESRPVKVEAKPENADRDNLCPAQSGKFDSRAARRE